MYGQDVHMHQSLLLLCTVKLNCLTVSNCPQTLDWADITDLLLKFIHGLKTHPATTGRLVYTQPEMVQHLDALASTSSFRTLLGVFAQSPNSVLLATKGFLLSVQLRCVEHRLYGTALIPLPSYRLQLPPAMTSLAQ